jgi:hypothetical protein
MTWDAAFRCLNCQHFWRQADPEDAWEMVCKMAAIYGVVNQTNF